LRAGKIKEAQILAVFERITSVRQEKLEDDDFADLTARPLASLGGVQILVFRFLL
jgi:hypothetical protein